MTKPFSAFFGCLYYRQPLFFLVVFLLIIGCENKSEEIHRDYKVLFTVNGIERTIFDFESEYVDHLIKTGRNDTRVERYSFMNKMIDNLVLAEAGAEAGLLDHPKYLSAIEYQLRKSMLDFYFVDEMGKLIDPPTDDEIRLAYAKRQRQVYVSQLFSRDVNELAEPLQRLQEGESFVDVANDFYATERYDSLAGYLGPISYFGVDDEFAEAAFSTNEGEFTQPIRTRYGYHIIKVEYIEFPGMLTEDEYQYRKQGVSSQLKLRRQKIVSNDYVRTLMEGLNVEPDRQNLSDLRDVILNLDGTLIVNDNANPETAQESWTDDRLDQLEASFDLDKVLATYKVEGEDRVFTFREYIRWLPYLSFQESKIRTGASVGRGLRNEVIYQLASENSYDQDERVKDQVQTRAYEMLSDLHQHNLMLSALADTSSIQVPNSYLDRLISSREISMQASYWRILAQDLSEAELIKEEIVSGDPPISFDSYKEVQFGEIDPADTYFELVRKSLINQPILAHSATDGWMVLFVSERETSEITSSTGKSNIETSYRVFSTIDGEINQLREKAKIEVDTLLFDSIYELWKGQKEKSE